MAESTIIPGRVLYVDAESEQAEVQLHALSSATRLQILNLLRSRVLNVGQIAEELGLPASTATSNINALEEAGLISTELRPATRGLQKVCARAYDAIIVELARGAEEEQQSIEVSMPVGAYVDCQVAPTCGLASDKGIIGFFDDPASFFEPDRVHAQLLWFHYGFVAYRFPNRLPPKAILESLSVSLEICSEAPLHHEEWPSDVTMWINDVKIGTWTSPADFGGQQGVLTPDWWESWNSQYGLLKVWQVNAAGSFVDGRRVSDVTAGQLKIRDGSSIAMRVGVQPEARNVGGINIFGRGFGNYPQDIVLRLRYH